MDVEGIQVIDSPSMALILGSDVLGSRGTLLRNVGIVSGEAGRQFLMVEARKGSGV